MLNQGGHSPSPNNPHCIRSSLPERSTFTEQDYQRRLLLLGSQVCLNKEEKNTVFHWLLVLFGSFLSQKKCGQWQKRVPQGYNSKLHLKRLPSHPEKIVAQITGTHTPLLAVSSISTLQMACPSVLSVMHKKVLGFTELWLHATLHENYYYTPLIISNYYTENIHFIL